jgi:predicted amidohydrolase
MIIAAAQTKPGQNTTDQNILDHLRLVDLAAQQAVELILFPEMSLTGYQREHAEELSFIDDDPRLSPLKEKADLYKMTIIAGAPIKSNGKLHIGAFIIQPGDNTLIYTKQFLHSGEEHFFSENKNHDPLIKLNDERISVAICADINNPLHTLKASEKKTSLYLASIFYSPGGIAEAYKQLGTYSKKYSMKVLMANYGGPSYNFESVGQSAYWNERGELMGYISNPGPELLIVQT